MSLSYTPDSKVLIVGAGCFGLSTGYHLLKRGFRDVTVIDRSEVLPAPDAASTDLNKIVRSAYGDIFYTKLAREAIERWKDEGEWGVDYHECGVLVLGSESPGRLVTATTTAYENDLEVGCRLEKFSSSDDNTKRLAEAMKSVFPVDVRSSLGGFVTQKSNSYFNRDGGWVYSAGSIAQGMHNVTALGGKIVGGKEVGKLLREGEGDVGKVCGVLCADGSVFRADVVVVATGSWTSSVFADLDVEGKCMATGQSIAMVQLTPEEADRYRHVPVILDQDTGFYIFPPNSENIMKFAIHEEGYTRCKSSSAHSSLSSLSPSNSGNISTPRTTVTHGEQEGSRIPKRNVTALRNHLREYYPDLADTKPFVKTRLCWYTDTPDDNWMIGPHPTDRSLVFATGGSGHAFKFFPVIGRLVADVIQGTLPADLVKKFAVERPFVSSSTLKTRHDQIPELDENELCTPADLLVPSS